MMTSLSKYRTGLLLSHNVLNITKNAAKNRLKFAVIGITKAVEYRPDPLAGLFQIEVRAHQLFGRDVGLLTDQSGHLAVQKAGGQVQMDAFQVVPGRRLAVTTAYQILQTRHTVLSVNRHHLFDGSLSGLMAVVGQARPGIGKRDAAE